MSVYYLFIGEFANMVESIMPQFKTNSENSVNVTTDVPDVPKKKRKIANKRKSGETSTEAKAKVVKNSVNKKAKKANEQSGKKEPSVRDVVVDKSNNSTPSFKPKIIGKLS